MEEKSLKQIKGHKKALGPLGVLLCAAGAGVFLLFQVFRPPGGVAEIRYDGQVVARVSLSQNQVFSIAQDPTVRFEVKDGRIRFVEATCPDKICEEAGFLSRVGDTAACLPRKTVVTVTEGEEREADLIAG